MTLFTIGHSTRSLEEFTDLLQESQIGALVDVRRLPGSRRFPHFNDDVLAEKLPELGISYRRAEELTGRRKVSTTIAFEVNGFWNNRSFHNYADHALSSEFSESLQELIHAAQDTLTVIMCSEAVWWRCHRRIISDHLLAAGQQVNHIMGPGNITEASLTEGAVIGPDDQVTYPEPQG